MNLQGDECWTVSVNGPGGTGLLVSVNDVRGAIGGYTLLSQTIGLVLATSNVSSYFLTQPLTGPLSVLAPADPQDGQLITVINASDITFSQTITLTQSPDQTVKQGGVTALAAGSSAMWQFTAAGKTWYRLR